MNTPWMPINITVSNHITAVGVREWIGRGEVGVQVLILSFLSPVDIREALASSAINFKSFVGLRGDEDIFDLYQRDGMTVVTLA